MAATYDVSLIATSILPLARSLFRDVAGLQGTDVARPLLQDEEYLGYVARFGEREGLAKLAETLAAVFAQRVAQYAQSGGIDVTWPNRPDFYLKLADSLRKYGVEGSSSASGSIRAGAPATPSYCTDPRLILA